MIIIKNKSAIEKMKKAGYLLSSIVNDISSYVREGISSLEIDSIMEDKIRTAGLKPECKGYAGYKHATCISVNDTIVHGVPSKDIVFKNGDFVKIDVVASYKGYCADMTRYFFIGQVPTVVKLLASTAQRALDGAIALATPGRRLSDISSFIQKTVESEGFGVVRCFAGHGIGKNMHEDPEILNYGRPGQGPILKSGMTLAIEPMITEGSYEVKVASDGWSAKTVDGGYAAHVEDTILITDKDPVILTRFN